MVLIKALYGAIEIENFASVLLVIFAFVTLISCRILNTICALGKACDLMQTHQKEKQAAAAAASAAASTVTTSTGTTVITSSTLNSTTNANNFAGAASTSNTVNIGGIHPLPMTPPKSRTNTETSQIVDALTSPNSFTPLQRSKTVDAVTELKATQDSSPSSPNNSKLLTEPNNLVVLHSNSDVDLDRDVHLNEHLLNEDGDISDDQMTRSEPDLQQSELVEPIRTHPQRRTHKRSESEPFIHAENGTH